ncbi:MAG: flagellar basal body rod protein FlgC [Planctomycetes bacterium]|nr:flagellar basal body rod protein FlgC [Planctomycetota bacterium]
MFGALDVSTSALIAQRTRLNTISANLANQNSILDAKGNYAPYQRRIPIFAAGDPATGSDLGVHVKEIELDPAPFQKKYQPGSPYADKDGYVNYPNVDPAIEMVNALEASRAYEANITAAESTKSMMNSALRLLA